MTFAVMLLLALSVSGLTVSIRAQAEAARARERRTSALYAMSKARHAGKVLTHRQLLQEVWGPPYTEQAHYLRVYMAQLRRKFESDAARPRYLLTEPGVGYRVAAE